MAIILAVIGFIVGFIIAIPILIVLVPVMIAFVAGDAQNWSPLIFAFACACLYTPVTWLLYGITTAYTESAWTLTYMRLTQPLDNPPAMLEANA